MTTLDEDRHLPDPSSTSVFPTALRYGIIGALISIGWSLIGFMTGLNSPNISNMIIGLVIGFGIFFGVLYFAMKKHRDADLGGYISYGRCLGVGVLTAVIMSIVSGLFNYVYVSFVDPDFLERTLAQTQEMLENFGMPEEAIEEAMENARNSNTPLRHMLNAILGGGLMGLIASLIVGAFVKRNPPEMV